MKRKGTQFYIGTSGWCYNHWGPFYPEDLLSTERLQFYAEHFQTVELNNTFYHSPPPKIFHGWRQKTPRDFIFAVKASRFITHIKRLRNVKEPWLRFIQSTSKLKEKLGPILFQLPPSLKADLNVLEAFLKILSKEYLYSFEPRHLSWFSDGVYQILKKYKVALCISDSPKFPSVELVTSEFVYLRFHGGKILYGSKYSQKELRGWAKKIKKWLADGLDVYAYFNNDAHGFAVENAKELAELLK